MVNKITGIHLDIHFYYSHQNFYNMAQYENENASGQGIAEPGIENQPNGNPGRKENPTNANTQVLNADEDVINGDTNNPVTNTAKEISASIDETDVDEEADLTTDDDVDEDEFEDENFDDEDLDEEDEDEADNNVRDAFNDDSLKASK